MRRKSGTKASSARKASLKSIPKTQSKNSTKADLADLIRRLREQNRRLEKIIRSSPAALMIVKAETGALCEVNGAWEDILGYSAAAIIGKAGVLRLLFKDDTEYAVVIGQLEDNEAALDLRCYLNAKDKEPRIVQLSAILFRQNGEKHYLFHFYDLTETLSNEKTVLNYDHKIRNLEKALNASSLVSITDAQGVIIYVNGKFCEVSEYSRDELLGQDHRIINSGHHSREFMQDLWSTIRKGGVWRGDIRNRKKGGGYYWAQSTIIPFLNKTGKPYQFYTIRQDITERKIYELKIQQSENNLALAQRIASLGSWNWRIKEDTLFWSDEIYRIFGREPQQTPANYALFIEGVHPQDRHRVQAALDAAVSDKAPYSIEHKVLRPNGEIRSVDAQGAVVFDQNGKPLEMTGIMQDITERRKADARLREQATLLDKAGDAILVRSLDDGIQYWNKGAEKMYGWTSDEVGGRSIRDLLYDKPETFDAATAEVLRNGEFHGELRQITKDLRPITVQARWTLVRDEDGKPKSILAINSDITDRKKLEQQFLRAQRLESIGTLAGGIAHDLNNVLTPILLAIEVLKMGNVSAEQTDLLSTVELSAKRGADMVKQVLSFARGVEGNPTPMQVAKLISDLEKIIRDTFPKNIRLHLNVPADLWVIKGDMTQLHQVLLNIAVNARDAMPNGGDLTISAENRILDAQYAAMNPEVKPGNYIAIRVEDNGSGMPPEILEKIFEPFFTTKEVGKGTGLGLSTSIAIIKGHGGFVRAYSEPGRGTKFHVYFPALLATQMTPESGEIQTFPRGNGELILVVDDEASIRNITRQTLETFNYRVYTAADGAEAVAVFAEMKDEIALILTDMMMPVLDGAGTIRAIRKMSPKIPIIAASGLEANGKVDKLLGEGIKFFLSKPYAADVLLKTVKQALSPGENIAL